MSDRHVVAQYLVQSPSNGTGVYVAPQNRGYVALNGVDASVAWSNFQQTPNSSPVLWKGTATGSGSNASTIAFSWNNDSSSIPGIEVDRLDLSSGNLLTSGILTDSTTNFGTLDAGDSGSVAFGWDNSGRLASDGTFSTVFSGYFPNRMAWGNFGSLGRHLLIAQFSDNINVMGDNPLDPKTPVTLASQSSYVQMSDLAIVDMDGDGWDEVIGTPYDYDNWGLITAEVGGYIVHPSTQPHGLKLLRVAPTFPIIPTAVSRKVHGTAGTFDIPLPLTGTLALECRSGGVNRDFQIVLTFPNPVTVERAAVTAGIGSVLNLIADSSGQVTVNLTGVTNAQTIKVTLTNISYGVNSGDLTIPMVVLFGDVNSSLRTDAGDVTAVRNHAVSIPDQNTFRFDVNTTGRIDAGDVTATRNATVTVP